MAGAEVMAWHLLSNLERHANVQVTAICLNEGVLAEKLRASRVPVVIVPEDSMSFGQIARTVARVLKTQATHILHSHRYKEHLLAAGLALSTGARTVATVHGFPEPARTRRRRYALQAWSTYQLLRYRFDAVVAVSSIMKQTLVEGRGFAAARVYTIANGVEVPERMPAEPRTGLHVGSVGRLVPVKRFERFLESAQIVRQSFPDVRFSILGSGPDEMMLKAQARTLGLDGCFAIHAPAEDPTAYYRSLDVYLNTSESEGLPLSILEAMANGIPVVAAGIGGIPEIITHGVNGLLVGSDTPQDFAGSCAQLLADPATRERLGHEARTRVVSAFSAERMAERYIDVYRDILGDAAGEWAAAPHRAQGEAQ